MLLINICINNYSDRLICQYLKNVGFIEETTTAVFIFKASSHAVTKCCIYELTVKGSLYFDRPRPTKKKRGTFQPAELGKVVKKSRMISLEEKIATVRCVEGGESFTAVG